MINQEELGSLIEESLKSANLSGRPVELYTPIEYIISVGGKRLRPKLCLLVYSLFRDDFNSEIINPALGLEIFHGFTLIHDDIMDKSDLRRGMPTVHKKWNDNIALLSGDVMSIMAYKFIAQAPKDRLSETLDLFSTTAAEVCEGQQFDMNFENQSDVKIENYLKMIGLKTAVFIACAAKMGAIIAGADKVMSDALYNYGYNIGIAFQIMDDYLDSFGDSNILGKKIGKDIIYNKKTWLLIKAMEIASPEQKKNIEQVLNMKDASTKIEAMLKIYKELRIEKLTLNEVEKYHKMAYNNLDSITLTIEQKEQLNIFGTLLINRIK